jgi:SAM-dependent methyltransferase
VDEYRDANRANWDDRVSIHWQPDAYDAPGFIADPDRISQVVALDRPYLGDVEGKGLLHLQCHFGHDTLSWARLGAVVTGLDFSPKAIQAAETLSKESGTPGRFVESELYDAPAALEGERFDIVYTGVGAINWLPDIAGWGRVVNALLAPGGIFYIREGHPVLWSLEWPEEDRERLEISYPYFETAKPMEWDEDTTYEGTGTLDHTRTYEWNHSIAEIMGALTDAGLVIDLFEEHRRCIWKGHPWMVLDEEEGLWRMPDPDLVPLMYSLRARKT